MGWWAEAVDDFTLGCKFPWVWAPSQDISKTMSVFVHSFHMERYTVLCCWVFFFQTSIQTIITMLRLPGKAVEQVRMAFNIVFSVCYVSFLIAYIFMLRKPTAA